MKASYFGLILLMSMGLSGCSIFNLQQDSQQLQKQLNQIQQWQVRGKLSVVSPDDAVTGYLTWQQDKEDFDLFLSGPFGQGSSRLVGNNGQATLTLPNQEPVNAPSAEYLMARYLGWQFPVLDLRYWVKGQASPHSDFTEVRDTLGLLESLQQHGWQVEFSRYQNQGGTWLPGRVKIIGHDFKFIFAIKEWSING
jgi:outer membrane lipoprotein LolB